MRISLLLLTAFGGLAVAQDPELKTENLSRPILPWSAGAPRAQARAAAPAAAYTAYHWAAFTAVLGESDLARLSGAGVEILGFAGRPGGYRVYKVRVGGSLAEATSALRSLPTFVNLLEVLPEEKVPAKVLRGQFKTRPAQGKAKATVTFHRPLDRAQAEALLKGSVDGFEPGQDAYTVHVVASPQRLQALADLDEVARVEDFRERLPLYHSRDQSKVSALQYGVLDTLTFPPTPAWNSGLPYTGDSIWICTNEDVNDSILDFREAVPGGSVRRGVSAAKWSNSPWVAWHGTYVAGMALGNGWNSEANGAGRYQYRGVAPKALLTGGYRNDGDVVNTSTASGTEGYYNSSDWNIDNRTSRHVSTAANLDNTEVWPAGNNGTGAAPGYGVQRGYYSLLVNAKNAIKVGSTQPDGKRSTFSGVGPTRDGRLGPDVCAPGGSVISVSAGGQGYYQSNGTSFAAPHVAGIVALMLQKYRDQVLRPLGAGANIHDNPPWNSTIRALLVHTATDMSDLSGVAGPDEANPDYAANGYPGVATIYPAGPDFATGYGRVDAQKAMQFLDPAYYREGSVGQGQVLAYNIAVPSGRSNLRVTLAWDDPPILATDAATAYSEKLVNDLDLRLVSPTGQTYLVYAPDHSLYHDGTTIPADGIDPVTPLDIQAPTNLPPARDAVSNLEVKDIQNPAAGTWRIEVHGYEIALDQSADRGVNQDFSLVSDIALPAAPAASGPDLVISKLVAVPARPVIGEEMRLVATLYNRGDQATPAVGHGVGFYARGALLDAVSTPAQSLAPGQSVVVPARVPYVVAADYQADNIYDFGAVADAPDLFAESSEQNNARTLAQIPAVLPAPWTAEDIGPAGSIGLAMALGLRAYRLESSGEGFGGTADAFRFLHRPLYGDGEIRALFDGLYGAASYMKAGVMIREGAGQGARYAMLAFNQLGTAWFQHRTSTGGATTLATATSYLQMHARLARVGNLVTAYVSADGTTWTEAGSVTLAMSGPVRIGLAVAGYPTDIRGNANVSRVAVSGAVSATLSARVVNASGSPMQGVTVSVSGCGAGYGAVTDAAGRAGFSSLPMGGNCVVTAMPGSNVFLPATVRLQEWDSDREVEFTAFPASLPSPWATADIGATGTTGVGGQNAGHFTLKGGGADIQGTADGFRYVYQGLGGDGEIRARVDRLSAQDPFAKAGVMLRDGLAANSANVFMALTNTQGATFQSRASAGGGTAYNLTGGYAAPYWVRLVRTGNVFTGYRSPDGAAWTQQGQVTLPLGTSLSVGLATTSHNTGASAIANFSDVKVSSLAFAETDIGSPGAAGSRTASGDAHTVRGSGADIWGASDAFHFSYLNLSGDGEIRARVASVQNTNTWAKAGVMIRENLAANARNFLVAATPGQGVTFQRRLAAGGSTVNTVQAGLAAPQWVRLVRAGNLISAFRSANGLTWTLMGQETLAMSANVYVGLAVTSHSAGVLASGVFDNVQR